MSVTASPAATGRAPTARWEWLVLGLVLLIGSGIRLLAFTRSFSAIDLAFVPDDTYYTLAIARSLAHGHGPVAGAGIASSGFQPLLAFLMVPVYRVTDDLQLAFRADLLLLIVADLVSVVLLYRLGRRIAGPAAGLAAALVWAASPVALRNAMGGLEASLAVMLALALLLAWMWTGDAGASRVRFAWLGVIAGLLVLARVDAALLVALVAAMELVLRRGRRIVPAVVGLAIVTVPWYVYTTLTFGTPLPTSGNAEGRLATLPRLGNSVTSLTSTVLAGGPFTVDLDYRSWFADHSGAGALVFWSGLAALTMFGAVAVVRRRASGSAPTGRDAIGVFALFAAGLTGFYGWYGVFYYDIRYLLPVAACVALIVATAGAVAWRRRRALRPVVAIVAVALLAVSVAGSVTEARRSGQEHALHSFLTGFGVTRRAIVDRFPAGARVAAYQSGALSYFGADRLAVVNLDGVVNPDAPPADDTAATARYASAQCVRWIADDLFFVLKLSTAADRHPSVGLQPQTARGVPGDPVVITRLVPRPDAAGRSAAGRC
jgi:Dolichyl-phosphate-mannose-protein mannosyltransferase